MAQPTKDPGYIELELLSGTKNDKEIEQDAINFANSDAISNYDEYNGAILGFKAGWKAHEEYIKNKV